MLVYPARLRNESVNHPLRTFLIPLNEAQRITLSEKQLPWVMGREEAAFYRTDSDVHRLSTRSNWSPEKNARDMAWHLIGVASRVE
jgi:hypothetical protein